MKSKERHRAAGALDDAIQEYVVGFEADWRDTYPGINAVTLMDSPTSPIRAVKSCFRLFAMRLCNERGVRPPTIGTTQLWLRRL